MIVDINMQKAILANTWSGTSLLDTIRKEAKLTNTVARKLIDKMQMDGLVFVQGDLVRVTEEQRLRIASKAIADGADIETISQKLLWKEFEGFAALVLEADGYDVRRNVRFKSNARRFEVDLAAFRKPNVLCIDCKHWKRALTLSRLKQAVKEQVLRTEELARGLPFPHLKISFATWQFLNAIPVILSLVSGTTRFCDEVPVVPILQFHDFLMQFPAYAHILKHSSRGVAIERLD